MPSPASRLAFALAGVVTLLAGVAAAAGVLLRGDLGTTPFVTVRGERWYGRGTVDNKGQHLIAIHALRAVLAERGDGTLGFNAKVIVETGEEQGSPGLRALIRRDRDLLDADVFIGLDGPRQTTFMPELKLGARGGVAFDLLVDCREGEHHSGHWGGVLTDPATTHPLNRLSGPKKLATNGLAGRAYSSAGVPLCRIRPSSMTWIRSATRTASSASWVTMRTGVPARRSTAITSSRTCSRSVASRLENGSSSSIRRGLGASALANATRCCSPPESMCG